MRLVCVQRVHSLAHVLPLLTLPSHLTLDNLSVASFSQLLVSVPNKVLKEKGLGVWKALYSQK